jgi:hypothetical protein
MACGTTYSGDGGTTPDAGPGHETLAPIAGPELNDSKAPVKKMSPTRKLFQRFSKVSNSNNHSKSRRWPKISRHSLPIADVRLTGSLKNGSPPLTAEKSRCVPLQKIFRSKVVEALGAQ